MGCDEHIWTITKQPNPVTMAQHMAVMLNIMLIEQHWDPYKISFTRAATIDWTRGPCSSVQCLSIFVLIEWRSKVGWSSPLGKRVSAKISGLYCGAPSFARQPCMDKGATKRGKLHYRSSLKEHWHHMGDESPPTSIGDIEETAIYFRQVRWLV